jgi:hypothetical protein
VETFHLSLREVERRFTKSELFLVAWRSQEVHHNIFDKEHAIVEETDDEKLERFLNRQQGGGRKEKIPAPQGVPKKFLNADGEVDLRQVTGEEAYQFLARQGMALPIMHK